MDLGLGNRTTLKSWLLPTAEQAGNEFDTALDRIGKAVAAQLEKHCNRRFGRVAGDTWEARAGEEVYVLPRYPIEELTTLEYRYESDESWVDYTADVGTIDEDSGVIYLEFATKRGLGSYRFTWTGGYWFDDSEDASGEQPAGSTLLPDDLQFAWLQQCKAVWELHHKIGVPIGSPPPESPTPSPPLLEEVARALKPYQRYSLL